MTFFYNHNGLKGKCGLKYKAVRRRNLILLFFPLTFLTVQDKFDLLSQEKSSFFSIFFVPFSAQTDEFTSRVAHIVHIPHAKNKNNFFLSSSHWNNCCKSFAFFTIHFSSSYEQLFHKILFTISIGKLFLYNLVGVF